MEILITDRLRKVKNVVDYYFDNKDEFDHDLNRLSHIGKLMGILIEKGLGDCEPRELCYCVDIRYYDT